VTVFAHQGDLADAAATALTVAGPEHWLPVARAMGVTGVMLVDEQGTVHMTPNLQTRIRFETTPAPKVILSEPLDNSVRSTP
jgi:thiamine biosynthesis lipoprotein